MMLQQNGINHRFQRRRKNYWLSYIKQVFTHFLSYLQDYHDLYNFSNISLEYVYNLHMKK